MKGFISVILLGCGCICCGSGCESEKKSIPTIKVEIPVAKATKTALNDGIITDEEFTKIKTIRRNLVRENFNDILN